MSDMPTRPEDMDTPDDMRTKDEMRTEDEMRTRDEMRTEEDVRTTDEVLNKDDMPVREDEARSNPEVMGRSEPQDVPGRRGGPTPIPTGTRGDLWPEMHDYRTRMTAIQSRFIDDPRGAVKDAEMLIDEAVDKMATAMHAHLNRMHTEIEGDADTEKLRLMMRDLVHMFDRLDVREAA
jgi:hypothetical protein